MVSAIQIASDALNNISAEKKQKIASQEPSALFDYFITKVKKNSYHKVSFILNECLKNDAFARAKFGNQRDGQGDTAYHHAASLGHREILVILNDKRAFPQPRPKTQDDQVLFSFAAKNAQGQRPLDLICLNGDFECFQEIWKRAGKVTHNPMRSFENGCLGGKEKIVECFLRHPKCNLQDASFQALYLRASNKDFGSKIKLLFDRKVYPNRVIIKALRENDVGLLRSYINEANVDLNKIDSSGKLPLDYLFKEQKEEKAAIALLQLLLTREIKLLTCNIAKEFPLSIALEKKWYAIFELIVTHLIKEGLNFEHKILILSLIASSGDTKSLNFFLQKCQELGDSKSALLNQFYNDNPLLMRALEVANFEVAKAFFNLGVSANTVDSEMNTPLQYAIIHDNLDFLSYLLARPEVNSSSVNEKGENCLHTMARHCARRVSLKLLTLPHIDVNQKNKDGETAVIILLKKFKILYKKMTEEDEISWNSALLETDYEGHHYNKYKNFRRIFLGLLQHPVDLSITDTKGQQALAIMMEFSDVGFVEKMHMHQKIWDRKQLIEQLHQKVLSTYNATLRQFYAQFSVAQIFDKALQYMKDCFVQNAREKKLKKPETLLEEIAQLPYVDFALLRLWGVLTEKPPTITDRYQIKQVNDSDYFYTFLLNKIYRLEKIEELPMQNYLITSLVYEAIRHKTPQQDGFGSSECQLIQQLIGKVAPAAQKTNLAEYKEALYKIETEEKNYFGENLSDDSDSEEEKQFQTRPFRDKMIHAVFAETMIKRSDPFSIMKVKGGFRKASKTDHLKLQKIYRSEVLSPQQERELNALNAFVYRGELNAAEFKAVNSKFLVAQYRGIAYRTDQFSQKQRQTDRKEKDLPKPLLCAALAHREGLTAENAQQFQIMLNNLKKSGTVYTTFNDGYQFAHALDALQDFYSKDYDGFMQTLQKFYNKLDTKQDVVITRLEEAILLNVRTYLNPFVSTSDTPDHALRYAFGSKYYDSYRDLRLRPRWRADGEVERPYSGQISLTLHDPLELISNSNHLSSMDKAGSVAIDKQTLPERETTFCGFIPLEQVVSKLIAKFPSFKKEHKEIYLTKYGLNKNLYDMFKAAILATTPHSVENKSIKNLLTEHLINFHEVSLIEEARMAAERRGKILVYRNEHGGFGLVPSETNSDTKSELGKEKQSQINQKRNAKRQRPQLGEDPQAKRPRIDAFLENLVRKFQIKCHVGMPPFKTLMSQILQTDENTLPHDVSQIAEDFNICIEVYKLEETTTTLYGDPQKPKISLYTFGAGQFVELLPHVAVNIDRA